MGVHCLTENAEEDIRLIVVSFRSDQINPYELCGLCNEAKQFYNNFCFTDFNELENEINSLRKNLKPKVNKLRDLEMKDDIKGFDLAPLSREELKHIDAYCD